jgi:tRNA pseudouridine38-40 synthase
LSSRFFFHIGYNGFNYRGWQRQGNAAGPSVQEVIEGVMTRVLKEPVSIMGCGRTDAQVHASQFFFHTDILGKWDYDLLFRLNKTLPNDIGIFEIISVDENRHARFDATSRSYDYFLHLYKDPFLSTSSSMYWLKNLNLKEMKQAVKLLIKYNDYRAFCRTPNAYRTTICNVTEAELYSNPTGDRLRFHISANRFLGKMIRVIVGKLLAIGKGEMSVDEFEQLLIFKQTPKLLEPAHPQGLFLSKVAYPYLDIPCKAAFSTYQDNTTQWQVIQASER